MPDKLCSAIIASLNHRKNLLEEFKDIKEQVNVLEKIASPHSLEGKRKSASHSIDSTLEKKKCCEEAKPKPVALVPPRMLCKSGTVSPMLLGNKRNRQRKKNKDRSSPLSSCSDGALNTEPKQQFSRYSYPPYPSMFYPNGAPWNSQSELPFCSGEHTYSMYQSSEPFVPPWARGGYESYRDSQRAKDSVRDNNDARQPVHRDFPMHGSRYQHDKELNNYNQRGQSFVDATNSLLQMNEQAMPRYNHPAQRAQQEPGRPVDIINSSFPMNTSTSQPFWQQYSNLAKATAYKHGVESFNAGACNDSRLSEGSATETASLSSQDDSSPGKYMLPGDDRRPSSGDSYGHVTGDPNRQVAGDSRHRRSGDSLGAMSGDSYHQRVRAETTPVVSTFPFGGGDWQGHENVSRKSTKKNANQTIAQSKGKTPSKDDHVTSQAYSASSSLPRSQPIVFKSEPASFNETSIGDSVSNSMRIANANFSNTEVKAKSYSDHNVITVNAKKIYEMKDLPEARNANQTAVIKQKETDHGQDCSKPVGHAVSSVMNALKHFTTSSSSVDGLNELGKHIAVQSVNQANRIDFNQLSLSAPLPTAPPVLSPPSFSLNPLRLVNRARQDTVRSGQGQKVASVNSRSTCQPTVLAVSDFTSSAAKDATGRIPGQEWSSTVDRSLLHNMKIYKPGTATTSNTTKKPRKTTKTKPVTIKEAKPARKTDAKGAAPTATYSPIRPASDDKIMYRNPIMTILPAHSRLLVVPGVTSAPSIATTAQSYSAVYYINSQNSQSRGNFPVLVNNVPGNSQQVPLQCMPAVATASTVSSTVVSMVTSNVEPKTSIQ